MALPVGLRPNFDLGMIAQMKNEESIEQTLLTGVRNLNGGCCLSIGRNGSPRIKKWWNTRALAQLLDTIVENNRIDKNRLLLTGLSRGGGAAWEMAVQYPEKFAALAIVCGMAPAPYAAWIDKKTSIWVFHGEEDESIPISESEEIFNKYQFLFV